jgi:hypothetical protein
MRVGLGVAALGRPAYINLKRDGAPPAKLANVARAAVIPLHVMDRAVRRGKPVRSRAAR